MKANDGHKDRILSLVFTFQRCFICTDCGGEKNPISCLFSTLSSKSKGSLSKMLLEQLRNVSLGDRVHPEMGC